MSLNVLIIEPFYGGSHKQLIDLFLNKLEILKNAKLITLKPKKWHWRARVSALQLFNKIPYEDYHVLFCSSTLNLTELIGLRPDLSKSKKIIYFHENQLEYPVQKVKERDVQYGYNQITSCIAADLVLFNSFFNFNSFLSNIDSFLNIFPDNKIRNIDQLIKPKCKVFYYPIEKPIITSTEQNKICSILWPHRWEHDKQPEEFFNILLEISKNGVPFRLSVLGESFTTNPEIFNEIKYKLSNHIDHFGYLENKSDYFKVLSNSDVVVSTSIHEFYGVAMIEAALYGCVPICPKRLSYPEIFTELSCANKAYFYNTSNQLKKIITKLCLKVSLGEKINENKNTNINYLKPFIYNEEKYEEMLSIFQP